MRETDTWKKEQATVGGEKELEEGLRLRETETQRGGQALRKRDRHLAGGDSLMC